MIVKRLHRVHQWILIGTFLPFCWLAFMLLHELGHIAAALVSGGAVKHVVVYPLTFSRTDVEPNPHPLLVVWAGPMVGVLLPLMIWWGFWRFRVPGDYLARFFAGFCLVANGAYIAIGSFDQVGDAGDMLKHGSLAWQLWLFGLVTIPFGFLAWHGQGPKFGLGQAAARVDARAAYGSLGLLLTLLALMFLLSPRF
ncbi:MAG: hypothetical protein VYE64_06985 [Planctomycetota bacterium]|nr:hypothetical protein [Planctomycetota bacterium]